jgi:hypothetical protein
MDNNTGTLVDDPTPGQAEHPNALQQAIQAIHNLIAPTQRELITLLRAPSPIKVVKLFTISAAGTLGGSLANPDMSQIVYTSPVSAESWLHRITISSPEHGPATPIIAPAQLVLISSLNDIVLQLPEIASTYQVAPTQFIEGRASAPHLSPGVSLCVSGDALPANHHLRIDLQISLVQGVSEYTPTTMSPTDLSRRTAGTAGLA